MIPETMYQALLAESKKIGVFGHGFTYGGHPVSAAVALKAIEIYARDRIVEKAAERGLQFQARLKALDDHPLVGEARGLGLIGGVELVADKAQQALLRAAAWRRCARRAVRRSRGPDRALGARRRFDAVAAARHQRARNRRLVRPANARARQDARLGDARTHRAVVIGNLPARPNGMNAPFTSRTL